MKTQKDIGDDAWQNFQNLSVKWKLILNRLQRIDIGQGNKYLHIFNNQAAIQPIISISSHTPKFNVALLLFYFILNIEREEGEGLGQIFLKLNKERNW